MKDSNSGVTRSDKFELSEFNDAKVTHSACDFPNFHQDEDRFPKILVLPIVPNFREESLNSVAGILGMSSPLSFVIWH